MAPPKMEWGVDEKGRATFGVAPSIRRSPAGRGIEPPPMRKRRRSYDNRPAVNWRLPAGFQRSGDLNAKSVEEEGHNLIGGAPRVPRGRPW
jgi:hypothetical protein